MWLPVLLTWLLALLLVLQVALCLAAWRTGLWGRGVLGMARRVHYSVVTIGGLLALASAAHLNLLLPP